MKDFTEPQRQALLDLLVLAMYLDGHLASVEDERVQSLLGAMGFASDYDRGREFDASVTRVRPHAGSPDIARTHALSLARNFTTHDQRRRVYAVVDDLLGSDNTVSDQESKFLTTIREVFEM